MAYVKRIEIDDESHIALIIHDDKTITWSLKVTKNDSIPIKIDAQTALALLKIHRDYEARCSKFYEVKE
jgi:hypothetical protein